jgi:pimeloyl-ACP methyl ester carboxylesterase
LPADRQSVVWTDDGLRLHAEEVGPRDASLTVVFVHGYTLNLGSFHFQRLALRERFGDRIRMVFYDQRSHGRSEMSPQHGCTIEQTGRDLHSVLEQLVPVGPVVLAGHSMGGMTVMALADQAPQLFRPDAGQVRAVALINTSSGDLRNITLGLPSALARLHAPVLPLVLRRAARNAALVERGRALGKDLAWLMTKRLGFADADVDPAVVAFCTKMIAATPVTVVADFYPTLMSHDGHLGLMNLTGCPVLVIGADDDALTPLAHSEQIALALPHAELVVVENSGHLLMLEHPAEVDAPLVELVEAAVRMAAPSAGRAAR